MHTKRKRPADKGRPFNLILPGLSRHSVGLEMPGAEIEMGQGAGDKRLEPGHDLRHVDGAGDVVDIDGLVRIGAPEIGEHAAGSGERIGQGVEGNGNDRGHHGQSAGEENQGRPITNTSHRMHPWVVNGFCRYRQCVLR